MSNTTKNRENDLISCPKHAWCEGHNAHAGDNTYHAGTKTCVAATLDEGGMRLEPDSNVATFPTVLAWMREDEVDAPDLQVINVEIRTPWESITTYLSPEQAEVLAAGLQTMLNELRKGATS